MKSEEPTIGGIGSAGEGVAFTQEELGEIRRRALLLCEGASEKWVVDLMGLADVCERLMSRIRFVHFKDGRMFPGKG